MFLYGPQRKMTDREWAKLGQEIIADERDTLEQQARAYGNDSKQVEERLKSAVSLLLTEYRRHFKTLKTRYDASRRMLIAGTDRYALVWQLRQKPDQPIGYENQQSSVGIVILVPIGVWEVNPNR